MKSKIDPKCVKLRDFSNTDIVLFLDYIYHSPAGFMDSIAVDLNKMPSEVDMSEILRVKCGQNGGLTPSKMNWLTILYNGEAIGFHSIDNIIEGDDGIFHAHLWKQDMRQLGLGGYTYPIACKIFFERFNLRRILFKTPIQNMGAIRVKEKLGIRQIGEEVIDFGAIKDNTTAKVFEITREEAFEKS